MLIHTLLLLHRLTSLNLTNIKMGHKALTLLKDFLAGENRLNSLAVGYNEFTPTMVKTLITFIENKSELTELDISSTLFSASSLTAVLKALTKNNKIKKLTLNGNKIDKKEGVAMLKELIVNSVTIEQLFIRNCDLDKVR